MTYIDLVQVSGANYKVLLENDSVRVLQVNLPAGGSDMPH